ncbi:MAG: acyl-CoA dehydrogenase family protein, partial [Micromonosporaceae bacterium]
MTDLLDVDSLLSEEELQIRDAVRQLCRKLVDPYVAEWFERGEVPQIRELARELGALGLFGMHLDGYG